MPMKRKRHWKRPLVLPTPGGMDEVHREARVDLHEEPRAIPIEWNRNGNPIAWLGGGSEENGGIGRCELCCIRLHREGRPMSEAHLSRTACAECEVILCRHCWKQWRHEGGGHAPEHIVEPPEPKETPSPFTPKRQRSCSEREQRRHQRHRPESPPEASAKGPRKKAARQQSRYDQVRKAAKAGRKTKKNKKKANSSRTAAARTAARQKRPRDDPGSAPATAPKRKKR